MKSRKLPITRDTLLYISGPITPSKQFPSRDANIQRGNMVGLKWANRGYSVYVPHKANEGFWSFKYEDFMAVDFRILRSCEGIVMMEGWQFSPGAVREYDYANDLNLVVFFDEYFDKYFGE